MMDEFLLWPLLDNPFVYCKSDLSETYLFTTQSVIKDSSVDEMSAIRDLLAK